MGLNTDRRGVAATVTGEGGSGGSSESPEVAAECPHPQALLGGDHKSSEAKGRH